MTQLESLSKPFDRADVGTKPGSAGGDFVKHSTVTEKLLYTVGPFTTTVDQVIYDGEILTGVLLTLTVTIDGRTVSVTEAGDNDNPTAKTNGARLKDCMSDAIKRAAMRFGVGLHLWSQDSYRLHQALVKRNDSVTDAVSGEAVPAMPERTSTGSRTAPDVLIGDALDGEAEHSVVESSREPLPNSGGNDTGQPKRVDGVVGETELALPPSGDVSDPVGGQLPPAGSTGTKNK